MQTHADEIQSSWVNGQFKQALAQLEELTPKEVALLLREVFYQLYAEIEPGTLHSGLLKNCMEFSNYVINKKYV